MTSLERLSKDVILSVLVINYIRMDKQFFMKNNNYLPSVEAKTGDIS